MFFLSFVFQSYHQTLFDDKFAHVDLVLNLIVSSTQISITVLFNVWEFIDNNLSLFQFRKIDVCDFLSELFLSLIDWISIFYQNEKISIFFCKLLLICSGLLLISYTICATLLSLLFTNWITAKITYYIQFVNFNVLISIFKLISQAVAQLVCIFF